MPTSYRPFKQMCSVRLFLSGVLHAVPLKNFFVFIFHALVKILRRPWYTFFCCERIFWWVDCPTCVFISSPFFSPHLVSKATQSKTVMKNMRKMEKLNQHLENCSGAKRTSCKLMICYFLPLILSRQIYCCIPLCVHSFCLYIQALPMCVRMNKNLYLLNLTSLLRRL